MGRVKVRGARYPYKLDKLDLYLYITSTLQYMILWLIVVQLFLFCFSGQGLLYPGNKRSNGVRAPKTQRRILVGAKCHHRTQINLVRRIRAKICLILMTQRTSMNVFMTVNIFRILYLLQSLQLQTVYGVRRHRRPNLFFDVKPPRGSNFLVLSREGTNSDTQKIRLLSRFFEQLRPRLKLMEAMHHHLTSANNHSQALHLRSTHLQVRHLSGAPQNSVPMILPLRLRLGGKEKKSKLTKQPI